MPIFDSLGLQTPAVTVHSEQYLDIFQKIHQQMQRNYTEALAAYTGPLFTAGPARRKQAVLTRKYAEHIKTYFGETVAQELNCTCCKNFLHFIGGLRGVTPNGVTVDLLWCPENVEDESLRSFFEAMHQSVMGLKTRRPLLLSTDTEETHSAAEERQCTYTKADGFTVGFVERGGWPHFHLNVDPARITTLSTWDDVKEVESRLSVIFEQIMVTLNEPVFTKGNIQRVKAILRSNLCSRDEFIDKVGLDWWEELITNIAAVTKDQWRDVIWGMMLKDHKRFAYATYALHSSSVWTIFKDISESRSDGDIARRFNRLTASHRYMRPTTEASDASIDRAEKRLEELGLVSALKRRGAGFQDLLPFITWTPKEVVAKAEAPAPKSPLDILRKTPVDKAGDRDLEEVAASATTNAKTITYEKFKRTVLPTAAHIWVMFYRTNHLGLFTFITQADETASPLLVWDHEENRCPISYYTYTHGARLDKFGGVVGAVYPITAIMPNPATRPSLPEMQRFSIGPDSDFFIIEGLKDTLFDVGGARLFPEIIRRDLQTDAGIRRVIESFSAKTKCEGVEDLQCGVSAANADGGYLFIVQDTSGAHGVYRIDRLD